MRRAFLRWQHGQGPLRARPDFGDVLLAFLGDPGDKALRTSEQVVTRDGTDFEVQSSRVARRFFVTRFGVAAYFGASGASGYNAWSGTTPFVRSGMTQMTVLFAGGSPLGSYTYSPCPLASHAANGAANTVQCHADYARISFTSAAYTSAIEWQVSRTRNAIASTVWSWQGSTSIVSYQDGLPSDGTPTCTGVSPQSLQPVSIAVHTTYVVDVAINCLLVSNRGVSSMLASELSENPWIAFEPARKYISYYAAEGASVSAQYARPNSDIVTTGWSVV